MPPGSMDLFITWLRFCQQRLLDRPAVSAVKYCHKPCQKEVEDSKNRKGQGDIKKKLVKEKDKKRNRIRKIPVR
jgi:hypothetical protein